MRNKRLALIICFALIGVVGYAQELLEVKVLDDQQNPLPFINVTIRNKSDSTLITGGVTDEAGLFRIATDDIKPLDQRVMTISALGFASHTITNLAELKYSVELKESYEMLADVVITAKRRPMTSITTDGISISLKDSPLSQIGTGMDLLAQLPMLSGNSESISVLGRGNPIIYINGRKANSIHKTINNYLLYRKTT